MCKTITVVFKAKCVRTNCLRRKIHLTKRFLFQIEEQSEDLVGGFSLRRSYGSPVALGQAYLEDVNKKARCF